MQRQKNRYLRPTLLLIGIWASCISGCGIHEPPPPRSVFPDSGTCPFYFHSNRSRLAALGDLPLILQIDGDSVSAVILSPFSTRLSAYSLIGGDEITTQGERVVSSPAELLRALSTASSQTGSTVEGSDFSVRRSGPCS